MYTHVLVPVSFDDDRPADQARAAAKLLAGAEGKVTLLHVIEKVPSYAVSYLPKDYVVEARKAIEGELAGMAAAFSNGAGVVVDGHSGRTIIDWAADHGVDCIVIASHHPGMQDLVWGSTAAQVVRHADCAVHVVR